jgi:hypothetical protein
MTELTAKIRALEQYSKALGEVRFTTSLIKGKAITVKLWRKYRVVGTPDGDSAEILVEALNSAVSTQKSKIDQVLALLSERCVQVTLNLFSKDVPDATQGNGDQSEGHILDPVEADCGGQTKSA